MSIAIKELTPGQYIEKVIILSLDLSLYQVSILVDGEEHTVVNSDRRPLRAHNKLELQSIFERFQVGEMVLRQRSCYDEMVGHSHSDCDNTLEVRLGNTGVGGPARLH